MRRALVVLILLSSLYVGACKSKETTSSTTPSASGSSPVVSTSGGPASSTNAPEKEAERVVRAWSDALDKHDVAALENLYGDQVVFYNLGPKPKKTVIAI